MHIGIITPAKANSVCGNRATATRWAVFLRQQGHEVTIRNNYLDESYDLLIALHAWRSAESIKRFRVLNPERPLVVALTGTDLYRFLITHARPTLRSIVLADKLIVLHELAHLAIPKTAWDKVQVIYQSAAPVKRLEPDIRTFDFCVIGHLRDEKDPMRPAYAVRDLPESSEIRILHYGKAHNPQWARKAHMEMARNPRYRWRGEQPHWQIRLAYARCRAMILPSIMEGGANVISEAVVSGLPIIASEIPGTVGLLGEEYAGYYPAQDTTALRELLVRAETESGYLKQLQQQVEKLAGRFTPEQEAAGLQRLLDSLR